MATLELKLAVATHNERYRLEVPKGCRPMHGGQKYFQKNGCRRNFQVLISLETHLWVKTLKGRKSLPCFRALRAKWSPKNALKPFMQNGSPKNALEPFTRNGPSKNALEPFTQNGPQACQKALRA